MCIASIYTVLGVMTLIDDPLTHFLWITISLFLAFYLIRIIPDYITAVGFGFTLAGAIPLWDETFLSVNQRTENTLVVGLLGRSGHGGHGGGGICLPARASRYRSEYRHSGAVEVRGIPAAADRGGTA